MKLMISLKRFTLFSVTMQRYTSQMFDIPPPLSERISKIPDTETIKITHRVETIRKW